MPTKERIVSRETCDKISEAKRGKKQSPEHIKNLANARRGFKQSEKQKKKVREACSKSWMITAPDGQTTIIKNLKEFCKKQSQTQKHFYKNIWRYFQKNKPYNGFVFKKLG